MIEILKLPENRFNQPELTGLKMKNFIFGKNGTGKSSITECIKEQYSEAYDVRVFQGYEQIIAEQGGLNVISLGTENTKLQPKIEEKEKAIQKVEEDLAENSSNPNSLKRQIDKQRAVVAKKEKEMNKFFSESAKKLKNSYLELFGPNYKKGNFERHLLTMSLASDESIDFAKKTFSQSIIEIKGQNGYRYDWLAPLVESINDILQTEIIEPIELTFNNQVEQRWVQEGVELHHNGDYCLFCGQVIPKNRRESLKLYFNDSVRKLNQKISVKEEEIKVRLAQVNDWELLDKKEYLKIYESRVGALNNQLGQIQKEISAFLTELHEILKNKKENIFLTFDKVETFNCCNTDSFRKSYETLYNENKKAYEDLNSTREKAKRILINDLVFRECNNFNYSVKAADLEQERNRLNQLLTTLSQKQNNLNHLKKELRELKQQTVDENRAANYINSLIKGLGNKSFTLRKREQDSKRGTYEILDYQGNTRLIKSLSTGEKNIVAFLWFVYNLQNIEGGSSRRQILVFDDPMNSNDDTTQYLIISELQRLLKEADSQIFILTHNAHFYINVRYRWWHGIKKNNNKATFRLIKNGTHSDVIAVTSENEDIKTSYDVLWKELKWLYSNGEPEYLLNPIRRILETYIKFNCISNEVFYKHSKEAEKLFNVNSHAIDDLENEPNGKSKSEIIFMLKKVFEDNGALNHFEEHFGQVNN